MQFIGNSANRENVWLPTGDEAMPSGGPTSNEVDQESHSEFMESFNTTIVSDLVDTLAELKEIK